MIVLKDVKAQMRVFAFNDEGPRIEIRHAEIK